MRSWLAAAVLVALAASAAAQSGYGGVAGAYAVYGAPPAIAAGRCDGSGGPAPPIAGAFGGPADRFCLGLVLEYAHDQHWVNWSTGRESVAVTPVRTYEADNGFCRDFLAVTASGIGPGLRTACRDAGGTWNLQAAPANLPSG